MSLIFIAENKIIMLQQISRVQSVVKDELFRHLSVCDDYLFTLKLRIDPFENSFFGVY